MNNNDEETDNCWHCFKEYLPSDLRKCGRCKVGLYCSAICQKLDYKPKHKAICKRLVVFGNNSSMQRPPEGRERDIYDGWAAQRETGYHKQYFTCQMNPSLDVNGTTNETRLANQEFVCALLAKRSPLAGRCAAAGERRTKRNNKKKINKNNKKDSK